jgi:hypothetical protein
VTVNTSAGPKDAESVPPLPDPGAVCSHWRKGCDCNGSAVEYFTCFMPFQLFCRNRSDDCIFDGIRQIQRGWSGRRRALVIHAIRSWN